MQPPGIHRSLQPLIAKGVNAGKIRPLVDVYLDRLTATTAAVAALKRHGFAVYNIDLNAVKPTITVQNCAACRRLIDSGAAIDYGSGVENGVRWRKWQMPLDGCRVVWTEGH